MDSYSILKRETIQSLNKAIIQAEKNWDFISGISGNGPIKEFEKEVLKITGGKYAIGLTNCTSALLTALLSIGIKQGDEVILPSLSWGQTLSPVLLAGATPVFADIQRKSVTIDVTSVEKLINRKTKAIIAVHLYGISADVFKLQKIAKKNNIPLIYDSAQLLYPLNSNLLLGCFGDFVAFSFGRNKIITAGEGGILVCNNRKYYEKSLLISQHPLRAHKQINNYNLRNSIDSVCLNFRMNPLAAVIGLSELKNYKSLTNRKTYKKSINIIKRLKLDLKNNSILSITPNLVFKIVNSKVDKFISKLEKINISFEIEKPVVLHLSNTLLTKSFFGREITTLKYNCPTAEILQKFTVFIIKQVSISNFS